jgi:CelD/BcsL family acetyltransferase involved in cellulose biosynthesis
MVKSSYEDEFGPISPVMLLIRAMLERAHEEGVREFDFLGGLDPWKLSWTRDTREHDWLYLMPPSLPLRLMHAAKFRLAPRLRRSPVLNRAIGVLRGAGHLHRGGDAAHSDRGAA